MTIDDRMHATEFAALDSSTPEMSAEDIAAAFAAQRVESSRRTDASGREPTPSHSRALEVEDPEVARAFTRARWSLEATLADPARARIARARLDLPRGTTWRSAPDVAFDPPMLDLRRSRVARYEDWLESGDPAADWGIVLSVARGEEARFEALLRLFGRARARPVYRARWNENRAAFQAATEYVREHPDILALSRGWEAVEEVCSVFSPHDVVSDERPALKRLRTAIDRLVAIDLLGPAWRGPREQREEVSLSEDLIALSDDLEGDVLTRATVDALMGATSLTPGERDALELDLAGFETAEIAKALGTTRAAIRRRRCDAWKKLRRTAEGSERPGVGGTSHLR